MKLIRSLPLVALLLAATPAWAQSSSGPEGHPFFAVDLHPVVGLADPIASLGFGFDVRGGFSMEMSPTVRLLPEAVIGYKFLGSSVDESFTEDLGSGNTVEGDFSYSFGLFRLMGGARALIDVKSSVRPSVFAHVGYGSWSSSTKGTARVLGVSMSESMSKKSSASISTGVLDLGGAIDFDLDENITLGGHLGLNWITADNAPTFLVFGLQGTYNL